MWVGSFGRGTLYAYTLPRDGGGTAPTFGSAVVPPLTCTVGTSIPPRVLPAATGGTRALAYSLTPALPAGLTFTAATRTLAGTPTAAQAATTYTLIATAAGATATLRFQMTVAVGPSAPGPTTPSHWILLVTVTTRVRRARTTASRCHHSSIISGRSFLPSDRLAIRAALPSFRQVGSSSRSGVVTAALDNPRRGRTRGRAGNPSSRRSIPRVSGFAPRSRGVASICPSGAGRRRRISWSTSCSAGRGELLDRVKGVVVYRYRATAPRSAVAPAE